MRDENLQELMQRSKMKNQMEWESMRGKTRKMHDNKLVYSFRWSLWCSRWIIFSLSHSLSCMEFKTDITAIFVGYQLCCYVASIYLE